MNIIFYLKLNVKHSIFLLTFAELKHPAILLKMNAIEDAHFQTFKFRMKINLF